MALVTLSTLFAVMADPANEKLIAALQRSFPEDHIQIRAGQWFVVSAGTAKEISDKLGVTPEAEIGAAVIVSVAGYYGRASSQIWEWVAAKVGKPTNA